MKQGREDLKWAKKKKRDSDELTHFHVLEPRNEGRLEPRASGSGIAVRVGVNPTVKSESEKRVKSVDCTLGCLRIVYVLQSLKRS